MAGGGAVAEGQRLDGTDRTIAPVMDTPRTARDRRAGRETKEGQGLAEHSPPGRTDDILAATRRLYEALYRFDSRAAGELGLHVTDLRCVNALEKGPLSAGEIGARLALTSGSVTALINRLARAGYVERIADAGDRRRATIALTSKFRTEADRVYSRLGRALGAEFAQIGPAESRAAIQTIEKLEAGFSEAFLRD